MKTIQTLTMTTLITRMDKWIINMIRIFKKFKANLHLQLFTIPIYCKSV